MAEKKLGLQNGRCEGYDPRCCQERSDCQQSPPADKGRSSRDVLVDDLIATKQPAPETVADVLEIVGTYGPYGFDIRQELRWLILLADEVKRLRRLFAGGPYKTGEPENDDGSVTVLDSYGESMTADEIVALLNTYSKLAVADLSSISSASAQRKPVAWRWVWMSDPSDGWTYTEEPPLYPKKQHIEPLYAAPEYVVSSSEEKNDAA